jgi:hypothetical protein
MLRLHVYTHLGTLLQQVSEGNAEQSSAGVGAGRAMVALVQDIRMVDEWTGVKNMT